MPADPTNDPQDTLLNVYPLQYPDGASVQYRIWSIDPLPQTSALREKIRSFVWQKVLHRPVFPMYVDGSFVFGIAGWAGEQPVQYGGTGERLYTVSPTPDRHSILLADAQGAEADLAAAILQAALVLHLKADKTLSAGQNTTHFYSLAPEIPLLASREVDIFRGFTFRTMYLEGVGICAVLDVRTSYIGRDSLAKYLQRGVALATMQQKWAVDRWINDYGSLKQGVFLISVEQRGIGDAILTGGGSTYDYLCSKYPAIRDRIAPSDPAVRMVYRRDDAQNESKHYTGASSLLKPQFALGSSQVRALRDVPAFAPSERLKRIEVMRGHLNRVWFAGRPVSFGDALRQPARVLSLPDLAFGEQDILRPNDVGRTEREIRQRWGASKAAHLKTHGPYSRMEFINPYLVYPAGLERGGLLDAFLEQTGLMCRELGRVDFNPTPSSYLDNAGAQDVIRKVSGIEKAGRAGFILLCLPANSRTADIIYDGVKSSLTLPSKCFSAKKLQERVGSGQKMASYIRGNTLAMLVENGARPWSLGTRLAHEMQFGFDSAPYGKGGLMGAAVIADGCGADIIFSNKEITAKERIGAKVIGPFVQQQLERFHEIHGRPPYSVLFQRDGRLLETEQRGIEQAITRFLGDHPGERPPDWTAVAIEKSTSVPLRVFRAVEGRVDAPFGGTYIIQQNTIAFLVLAGFPSRQGTPHPVRVEIISSNAGTPDMIPILRDIFWLSQLNWNTPEIDINLPLTLRFTDQKLERYAIEVDSEPDEPDDDWGDS